MRKLGIVATFSVMFVLSALAKPETGEGIVAEEQLTDTEVDPDLFRFSVSKLAESIGVKIRGLLGSRSAVDQVREIVDPVSLRYNYYRPVLQVLSTWTARTNYSGLFRVNQPLKPGLINLFVIDHAHLLAKAPDLLCNCTYIPGSWSIVCDELFLSSAQRLFDRAIPAPSADAQPTQQEMATEDKQFASEVFKMADDRFRTFMFEWIIAHELGPVFS